MYGSLSAMTSPSRSSDTSYGECSRIVGIADPNCPMTIRACRSAMSGNWSDCSRMTGLTAVVSRTRSISYRALDSVFSMMSSVTWSMSCSRTKSGSGAVSVVAISPAS
jgi:hypothetical protein